MHRVIILTMSDYKTAAVEKGRHFFKIIFSQSKNAWQFALFSSASSIRLAIQAYDQAA